MHNGWYVVGSLLVWIGVIGVLKTLGRHYMAYVRQARAKEDAERIAKGTGKTNGDNNVGT